MTRRDDFQERVPADLAGLDAALRGAGIEPRASLEPEIAGRFAAGERARFGGRRGSGRNRIAVVGVAALLLVAAGAVRGGFAPPLDAFAATATVDRCCADLDGGGKADDGVLVETVQGHRVRRIMLYEVQDADRAWTPGEMIRFVRRGAPDLRATDRGDRLVAREFCCSDYDGGGDPDDGVLVVASTAGDVLMAALFDRRGAPDHTLLR